MTKQEGKELKPSQISKIETELYELLEKHDLDEQQMYVVLSGAAKGIMRRIGIKTGVEMADRIKQQVEQTIPSQANREHRRKLAKLHPVNKDKAH